MERRELSTGAGIAIAGVWISVAVVTVAWLGFWGWIAVGTLHRVGEWWMVIWFFLVVVYVLASELHDHLVKMGSWRGSPEEPETQAKSEPTGEPATESPYDQAKQQT